MLVSDPPGLSLTTSRDKMLRAVLESIAFSLKQLVEAFLSETNYKVKCLFLWFNLLFCQIERLVVDGGVAQNDFIVQLIAELTGLPVVRPDTVEMSVWGVASLAGEQAGLVQESAAMLREWGRMLRDIYVRPAVYNPAMHV